MTEIACPSCQTPMGIDEHEAATEWECPTCASAFVVRKESAGTLQLVATSLPPSAPAGAMETEAEHHKRNSRRRRNVKLEASPDGDGRDDLDIARSQPSANPLLDRFPDMQPSPGIPPLWTINGVGFAFYGSRDFDEYTGTYVRSTCFCVFFVPILVLGSYRVIDAQAGGWHVLGKVPMSSLAKGWNWTMLALIGCSLLICLVR